MALKKLGIVVCLALIVLGISGCLPGPNPAEDTPDTETGKVSGFFSGVFHGFIVLCTWFVSLFTKHVNFYDVHNVGGWYDFGFLVGIYLLLLMLGNLFD